MLIDMRIIAGDFKGQTIKAVPGKQTRPTTDRVREAWASALLNLTGEMSFEGLHLLDAFAGSGALGLELLSRGAESCVFVEQDKTALATLKSNIASLGLDTKHVQSCMADSLSPKLLSCVKGSRPFDIVILDPPYSLPLGKVKGMLSTLGRAGLIVGKTLVSYEHSSEEHEDMDGFVLCRACTPAALHLVKHKVYGTMCLDFYQCW